MMKHFNHLNYERPNYSKTKSKLTKLIANLKNTSNYSEYLEIFKKIINLQNQIEEMHDYADINNMRNLKDEFYIKEITYWNKYKPKYDELFIPFYHLCLNSPYKSNLTKIVPPNFFNTIEYQLKLINSDIIELQQEEKQLKSKYLNIMNQKISYNGVEQNRALISKDFSNPNRTIRKNAHDAINNFYLSNQQELDTIYFDLIKVRNSIAKKLNFNNYTDYSIYSLRRFGYNYQDIHKFRDNIIKYIIPLCKKLNTIKKKNLNLKQLKYYDTCFYKEMPKPLHTGEALLTNLELSLKKLDKNLSVFYKEMLTTGYIDLINRENKVSFAITNYLTTTCYPTITGNFKNNYTDIQTIAHEFGHAYQKYNASIKDKDYIISALLKYPTFEIAEMFSHAMELITMLYLTNLFNNQDHKKYCLLEIYSILTTLPYICLVDEFQEQIYSTQNLTKADIRATWLRLAKKYHQEINNEGHPNLDSGGYFYRQSHLFMNPFYYIDYGLSYFGAFSIWSKSSCNLNYFNEIASIASYYPLDKLIKDYNMPNPFDEVSIKDIAKKLETELDYYNH